MKGEKPLAKQIMYRRSTLIRLKGHELKKRNLLTLRQENGLVANKNFIR